VFLRLPAALAATVHQGRGVKQLAPCRKRELLRRKGCNLYLASLLVLVMMAAMMMGWQHVGMQQQQ
jgi:hypothetical protein